MEQFIFTFIALQFTYTLLLHGVIGGSINNNVKGETPNFNRVINPEVSKTVPEWIQGKGFPVEIHNITTPDDYIITVFRIPHGRFQNSSTQSPKKVVYFQHGNFADGSSWIFNSVDKALAYRLADLGMDVWLGNARGTRYSLGHKFLSIKDVKFWDYSYPDVGDKDFPVTFDYILKTSNQTSLYFVAHSQGAAEFLTSMFLHPEYIPKIRTFIAIAPGVFQGNATNPIIKSAAQFVRLQQLIQDSHLIGPAIPPQMLPVMNIVGDVCTLEIAVRWICMTMLDAMFGFDPLGANYDLTPEIMSHILSSTSNKKSLHALQGLNTGEFEQYDYYEKNVQVYGTSRPPKFNLSGITVPTVIFHGAHDNLVTPPDIQKLAANLPNVKEVKLLLWKKFNHIDFLFHPKINELMNDRIVEIIVNDVYFN